MADVVISLGDANVKTGIAGNIEFLACFGAQPIIAALEFVFARSAHAFHDFWHAGVEGEGGGEDHAHRLFGAVCQGDVVADAFSVKVDVGLGGDGDVVDFLGGHDAIKGRVSWPRMATKGGMDAWHKPEILGQEYRPSFQAIAGPVFSASGDTVVRRPCRSSG